MTYVPDVGAVSDPDQHFWARCFRCSWVTIRPQPWWENGRMCRQDETDESLRARLTGAHMYTDTTRPLPYGTADRTPARPARGQCCAALELLPMQEAIFVAYRVGGPEAARMVIETIKPDLQRSILLMVPEHMVGRM